MEGADAEGGGVAKEEQQGDVDGRHGATTIRWWPNGEWHGQPGAEKRCMRMLRRGQLEIVLMNINIKYGVLCTKGEGAYPNFAPN